MRGCSHGENPLKVESVQDFNESTKSEIKDTTLLKKVNKFVFTYMQKLNMNQRVDDPNISSNALKMMIDYDCLKVAKKTALSKVGYDSFNEAARILSVLNN